MSIFHKDKKRTIYFDSSKQNTPYELGMALFAFIKKQIMYNKNIIFLCIGSDRATGDSLGPIIGYKLSKYINHPNIHIYGTLEHPVHAKNLEETIATIYQKHENAFIIAIDASLGKSEHIGYIALGEGPLKPGAGVNKDLPEVGDLYITGIVNFSGMLEHMLLQTTRLNVVMSLADQICLAISYCLSHLKTQLPHPIFFL